MSTLSKPIRCGHAINLTIDFDAEELLRDLCPSRKALGRFLSELVRREAALRAEREKVKAQVLAALNSEAVSLDMSTVDAAPARTGCQGDT